MTEHKSITHALLAVQRELPPIAKDMTAKAAKFSYDYVSLPNLLQAVLPILHRHDILLSQSVERGDQGANAYLHTDLRHVPSDTVISAHMPLPWGSDMQLNGAANTYARRYQLFNLLGWSDGIDTDAAPPDVKIAQRLDPSDIEFHDIPGAAPAPKNVPAALEEARKRFAVAVEKDNHPDVLKLWDDLRKADKASADKPMSEKQYSYMAGLIDKRYEDVGLQHGAILYCLLERPIDRNHRPGWRVAGNEKYPGILYALAEEEQGEYASILDYLVGEILNAKES